MNQPPNEAWAQRIIHALTTQGVQLCCISPGSRSTPLTAAAARHPAMQTRIFWDERSAAFFALGHARATGQPAALICTSGTAAANYYPAVIEASVDHIPMLILSADRPPELQDTGANQTINQQNLFGSYTRWHLQMPCPTTEIPLEWLDTTIAQAHAKATQENPGPVHLNQPFREPLAPSPQPPTTPNPPGIQKVYTDIATAPRVPTSQQILHLQQAPGESTKTLVVVGRLSPHQEYPQLFACCQEMNWPILFDPGAGMGIDGKVGGRIDHFEWLVRHPSFAKEMVPDTILHIGGPLLSKHLLHYVRMHKGVRYVHIQERTERVDPDHLVRHRLHTNLEAFATAWRESSPPAVQETSGWLSRWQRADAQVRAHLQSRFAQLETLQEPWLARYLAQETPQTHAIFLGNSMPIRYWACFGAPGGTRPTGMNRGASGIDGLLSTALGFFAGCKRPGVLYLGDLSLIHDLNALLWLRENPLPIVIVTPNNFGGGIFGHLPVAGCSDIFASHFHTPHRSSLAKIAAAIGLQVHSPDSHQTFRAAFCSATQQDAPVLIEVKTNSQEELTWFRHLEGEIKQLCL